MYFRFTAVFLLFGVFLCAKVTAQNVSNWQEGLHLPGLHGFPQAAVHFGNRTYVAGAVGSVGEHAVEDVAFYDWETQQWGTLAGEFSASISVMEVFDDGSGPALYVGGFFTQIDNKPVPGLARWNGSQWRAVGAFNGAVTALHANEVDGEPVLYAGGTFTEIGGTEMARAAQYRGGTWQSLGSGFDDRVRTFFVWERDGNPQLVAGGFFLNSGDGLTTLNRLAIFDGQRWSDFGQTFSGGNTSILSLTALSDDLVVCGSFDQVNGQTTGGLVTFDGSRWVAPVYDSSYTRGFLPWCGGTALFDPGGGLEVFFVPSISFEFSGVLRFDGATVSVDDDEPGSESGGNSFYGIWNVGLPQSPTIAIGGFFTSVDSPGANFQFREAGNWMPLVAQPSTPGMGLIGARSVAVIDGQLGENVLVLGKIKTPDAEGRNGVVRWTGSDWQVVPSGREAGNASIRSIDGSAELFALQEIGSASIFGIAQWDGVSFVPLSPAPLPRGSTFEVSGSANGFKFHYFESFQGVFEWNGASWQKLGAASGTFPPAIRAFDGGAGSQIFATGTFTGADGEFNGVGRWTGTTWENTQHPARERIPNHLNTIVWEGSQALFSHGGRSVAGHIFDGETWTEISGSSPTTGNFTTYDSVVFQNCIVAGGEYAPDPGSRNAVNLFSYCNEVEGWQPLLEGVNGAVLSLAVGDGGKTLWVSGSFTAAGDQGSHQIARAFNDVIFAQSFESPPGQ